MGKWYKVEDLPPKASIAISPTRYTNDELIIAWIRHFNIVIKAQTIGSKRLLLIDRYSITLGYSTYIESRLKAY